MTVTPVHERPAHHVADRSARVVRGRRRTTCDLEGAPLEKDPRR